MELKTLALPAALILGISAGSAIVLAPAASRAGEAIKITNKELADAINGAQADAKAGNYKGAIEKAKAADAISGKPPALTPKIHEMILSYSIAGKDYATALAELEKMIAANEGDKNAHLKQALSISIQTNNKPKIEEYQKQLGGNLDPETRLYIASSLMQSGQYKEALAEAEPLLKQAQPPEKALQFEQAVYFKMNNSAGRRAALEQLAANYPKLEYWHDLLQLARNEKGLGDEQVMDIYRLRLAVGDLKTAADYEEMAQQALIVGYPNEAKAVLDKASAAKLLNGERDARMIKMANDNVGKDVAIQADLQKKADADPDSALKLGLIMWSYGKNADAERLIRNAMKGKLSDPDEAKMALGHVLLSSGKKQDAVNAFNSVSKGSKVASVARLWAIYARKG